MVNPVRAYLLGDKSLKDEGVVHGGNFVAVNRIEYSGIPGFTIFYNNPPYHLVGTDILLEYRESLEWIKDQRDAQFLLAFRHNGPTHVGANLKESQENLRRSNDLSWARQRLDIGVTTDSLFAELSERMLTFALANGRDMYGGSTELPFMADHVLIGSRATAYLTEVCIGLIHGWASLVRFLSRTRPENVKYIAMTGEGISAQKLKDAGLVAAVLEAPEYPVSTLKGADASAFWDHYDIDAHRALFPQALRFISRSVEDISILPVYCNNVIMPHGNELDGIVNSRADPSNYDGLFGKPLSEAKETVGYPGRPLTPQSIDMLREFFRALEGLGPDEIRGRRNELVRMEADMDFRLYQEHTERLKRGIDAALNQTVADFK